MRHCINRKIWAVIILLSCVASLQAQVQHVTGRVTDKNNHPIEMAVVVMQTTDSVYLNSAYTDSLGSFKIPTNAAPFLLTVQHLAYETYWSRYDSPLIGSIQLNENSRMLADVFVRGEHPVVRVVDGRMTYDMPRLLKDKMASSAYEAILELPGVEEQRGDIALAGANGVTVVINGKATSMDESQLKDLLKSIPKERIQKAEIMYSAPPQYHVRGAVINLVLQSGASDTPQWQGQVNALYHQGYYGNYQGGATLVYSTPQTSTDFMYSAGYHRERTGEDILSHHLLNDKLYDIEQSDRGYSKTLTHSMRLGHDWFVNEENRLGFAYTSQIQQWARPFNSSVGTYSDSENSKRTDKPVQMHNLALSYTSGFGLSTGIDFTSYQNHSTQYYQEKQTGKESAFTAKSKQDIRRISFYADQHHALGKEWTLTYGTKFSFASDRSSQLYHSLDDTDWSGANSNSRLHEYVYDLYTGFSKRFSDKLSLTASLTGEYYKHKAVDYWSLFPMMEITYKLHPNSVFQLSVSSDKAYPNYWEMQNSVSYLNGYTEIQGNTDLKPSQDYSFQLNYILRNKYIFTLYGNYIHHSFSQLPYQSSDRLVLVLKTLNFDYSSKFGLNAMLPFKVGATLDSRLTLNGYYDKAKSDRYHDISFTKECLGFYANIDNTFHLSSKPNIRAELSGSYITRSIQGPMTISSMYRVDAGLKWTSGNNKAALSLKVNDMLNSWTPKELNLHYKTQDLVMRMLPDSRRISLSFTYQFGGFTEKKYKETDSSRFGK